MFERARSKVNDFLKNRSLRQKASEYQELLGIRQPDALLVLGAGVAGRLVSQDAGATESHRHKEFTPTSWDDERANFKDGKMLPGYDARTLEGAPGDITVAGMGSGKARLLAATKLFEVFKKPIIVGGRYRQLSHVDAAVQPPNEFAETYRKYLGRVGIPSESIFEESSPSNTIEELINIISVAAEKGWHSIGLVANQYQIARSKKMLEFLVDEGRCKKEMRYILPQLEEKYRKLMGLRYNVGASGEPEVSFADRSFFEKAASVNLDFIDAEKVLSHNNQHHAQLLAKVYSTQEYQDRARADANGIKDLEAGVYGKKSWEQMKK